MRLIGIEPAHYGLKPLILQGFRLRVLHFVLHLVKMRHNFLILAVRFLIDDIPVNGLHNMIRHPASALHDVLIRNSDGVKDAG